MKHYFAFIALLFIMILPTHAQEETSPCEAPFTTDAPETDVVMSIDEKQIIGENFANRFRFEYAYNIIKLEQRVALVTSAAEEANLETVDILAYDPEYIQMTNEKDSPQQLANRVLGDLASDVLVWTYANANDISIDNAAFEASIDSFFGINEENSAERDTIINDFTGRILTSGTIPSEITSFFCRQAIYDQVQNRVIGTPENTLYADVDHILVNSQEVAQDIITLISEGEDFAALAQELTLDTATADVGGALGWQAVVLYVREFADAINEGELNTIIGPVQTPFGWHVLRVNNREERPIEGGAQAQIIEALFARWRDDQLAISTISVNPDWQSFIPEL